LLAIAAVVAALGRGPQTLRYEPYTVLGPPAVDPLLLVGLAALLAPVWVSPAAHEERRPRAPEAASCEGTGR
jgi:hypothetical protein